MDTIKSYKDLEISIKISQRIIDNCNRSLHHIEEYYKVYRRKGYPSSKSGLSSYVDADTIHSSSAELRYDQLEDVIEQENHFKNKKAVQEEILEGLNKTKEEVEIELSKLDGLSNKIFYWHNIKGHTLDKVAEELGYSTSHIWRVNAEINKKVIGE